MNVIVIDDDDFVGEKFFGILWIGKFIEGNFTPVMSGSGWNMVCKECDLITYGVICSDINEEGEFSPLNVIVVWVGFGFFII